MLRRSKPPQFRAARDIEVKWESFNGGWNSTFKPTELRANELTQADNLMLIGAGTPTGRWGSNTYHLAGATGYVRTLDAFYNSLTSTNLLIAITDSGYLTMRNGASYTILPGASFPSGANYYFTEFGGFGYINGPSISFVKLSGLSLVPYIEISHPTITAATMLSAASGFNTYSWIVQANSQTGGTSPYVNSLVLNKSLASLPLDLTKTAVRIVWNTVSAASGVLTGYDIFRGFPGDETYIASVGPTATEYIDTGSDSSNTLFPNESNTTGGPRARFRVKVDDRIVLAGIDGQPDLVLISARYPYHDRFTAIDGGGGIFVSPDDGDSITGLAVTNLAQSPYVLVYKRHSTHTMTLDTVELGNFVVLDPQVHLLSGSNGAVSADTILNVEQDVFSLDDKGVYATGQQAQFLNQIRTNELSYRIRTYIQNLSEDDKKMACGAYIDNKYVISFPSKRETIIYDRERNAFMGPWKTSFGITKWLKYFDESGTEKWLAGSTDTFVREFSASYITDGGTAISKVLRTKKEDMGDWSIFKVLKLFYALFRNVRGTVSVNLRIEDRTGNTVTTKSFQLTSALGSGGWGNDLWGSQPYGNSDSTVTLTGDELARYAQIYKNCRVMQVEVQSDAANSNFEFLAVRMTGQPLGDQSLPASLKV